MGEKDDDDKKKKDDESNFFMKMLNSLNPFSGGFSIGGIFEMLLFVAIGGPLIYKALHSETVQGWLGKERVEGWLTSIDAFLEDKAPWLAHFLGAKEGAAAAYVEKMPHDDFVKKLTDDGKGLSPESAEVIYTYRADFIKTVTAANGSFSKEAATNDKTLFALLTSPDANVQKMMTELMPTLQTGSGGKISDGTKTVLASLQKIIATDKLDVLLDAKHRTRTIELLKQLAPGKLSTAEIEANFNILMADGTTNNIRTILTKLLTPQADGSFRSMQDIVMECKFDPNATESMKKATDALIKQNMGAIAGNSEDAKKVTGALVDQLDPETFKALTTISTTQYDADPAKDKAMRSAALNALVMKDVATATTFKKIADGVKDVASLPGEDLQNAVRTLQQTPAGALPAIVGIVGNGGDPVALKEVFAPEQRLVPNPLHARMSNTPEYLQVSPATYALRALMNGDNRAMIATAGTQNVADLIAIYSPEQKSVLTKGNLDVIVASAQQIATNPANQKDQLGNFCVLNAFVSLAANPEAAKQTFGVVSADQMSAFFSDATNSAAMTSLLANLDTSGLTPDQQRVFTSLKTHFGTQAKGLNAVLADHDSAQIVLDELQGKDMKAVIHDQLSWTRAFHYWTGTDQENMQYYITHDAPEAMRNNAGDIEAIMQDLKGAGVKVGTTGATASTVPFNGKTPNITSLGHQ